MKIIGISGLYHDSAAALLIDGEIIAAAQEERFTRKKHDPAFPIEAIKYILEEGKIDFNEVDHVVFYDKPFLKFERLIETYLAYAPKGFRSFKMAMPVWLREKLFLKDFLTKELKKLSKTFLPSQLLFSEHHLSHAASAYYPSPFDEAVVLTLDGVGEWASGTVAIGKGNDLKIAKEMHFPHSLGLLYSAITYYLGFKVNSGEYKVMGLAPYGEPKYKDLMIDNLMDLKEDGSFRLDLEYFNYPVGLTMTNAKFASLFGEPVRAAESEELTQFHMDVAASVQAVTEEIVLKITRALAKEYGIPNLCLAGGVALNCVANGKILKDGAFKEVWIQPASGDAGGALGAALAAWHGEFNQPRTANPQDSMEGSYLGPSYTNEQITEELTAAGAVFHQFSTDETLDKTAEALKDSKAVGWFRGRMEFGPRSLGCRSILGDPRSAETQKTLNLKVKYRESFRPFAPAILREDLKDWFDIECDSPYMLLVAPVHPDICHEMTSEEQSLFGIEKLNVKRSQIPAVTHVDYSARVQTVHQDKNPGFHQLISKFKGLTGCPVLVNTSFNVRGEPIVSSPTDAFRCFMGTELDVLVVEDIILFKEEQNKELTLDYKNQYELD